MRVLSRRQFGMVTALVAAAAAGVEAAPAATPARQPHWVLFDPDGNIALDIVGDRHDQPWTFRPGSLSGEPGRHSAVISGVDVQWRSGAGHDGKGPTRWGHRPYRLVRFADGAVTWLFGVFRLAGTSQAVEIECWRLIDELGPETAWTLSVDTDPGRVLAWAWGVDGSELSIESLRAALPARSGPLAGAVSLWQAEAVFDDDAMLTLGRGAKHCVADDADHGRYAVGWAFEDRPRLRLTHRETGRAYVLHGVRRVELAANYPGRRDFRPSWSNVFAVIAEGDVTSG